MKPWHPNEIGLEPVQFMMSFLTSASYLGWCRVEMGKKCDVFLPPGSSFISRVEMVELDANLLVGFKNNLCV